MIRTLTRRALGAGILGACAPDMRVADAEAAATTYDVVVFGATPSGIMAADAASRQGARVAVVEPTGYVGGALAQAGVSPFDLWMHRNVGGRSWQWLQHAALAEGLGNPGAPTSLPADDVIGSPAQVTAAYLGPVPHASEAAFKAVLALAGVDVFLGASLVVTGGSTLPAIRTSGLAITAIQTAGGPVSGRVFVDASYEGDVLAGAAYQSIAKYAVGRESQAVYGESLAGVGVTQSFTHPSLSLLDTKGIPLAPLVATPTAVVGDADGLVMEADFRPILTIGGRAFSPPPGYDRTKLAVLQQLLGALQPTKLSSIARVFAIGGGLFDLDGGTGPLGVTLPNAIQPYVEGTPSQRAAVVARHKTWLQSVLYFLATDPAVPAALAADTRRYGLAASEFADNGNWPRQLYVRETRRLQGKILMTQGDLNPSAAKASVVCLGSYVVDAKPARRFAIDARTIGWEGSLYATATAWWRIPMESLVPAPGQCTNLIVPVCSSASHVAWCATRMEPTFMMQGEAAGVIAVLAARGGLAVQAVPYAAVRTALLAVGAVLS